MIDGGIDGKARRSRIEMQRGAAGYVVKSLVVQHHTGRAEQFARADAAARALFAADPEQIGEIVVKQKCQIEARQAIAMILQADALIGCPVPEKDRAHDMQHVLGQHDPIVAIDVGIAEVDSQGRVVVAQIGAEQQRLHVIQHQLQPGEIARIGIEQAVRPAGGSADVAVTVKHDEGVIVLERTPRPRRGARHRNIERLFRNDRIGRAGRGDDRSDDLGCHVDLVPIPHASRKTQPDLNTGLQLTLQILTTASSPA